MDDDNILHKEERVIRTYIPARGEFPDFKEEVVVIKEGDVVIERKIVYKPLLADGKTPSQNDPPARTYCGQFVVQSSMQVCDRHSKARPIGPCCGSKFVFPDGLEWWVCNPCFNWLSGEVSWRSTRRG